MWHTGHLSQKRVSGREGGNRALECLYGYSVARKLASSAGMSMPGECLAAIFRGGSPRRRALGGGYYAQRRGKLYAATGKVMRVDKGGNVIPS